MSHGNDGNEHALIHGHDRRGKRSKEYRAWVNMVWRCYSTVCKQYKDYGGRGIRVCDEWNDFGTFLKDVGLAPSKDHTLDRINNDGNYEPGNVRWATRSQQSKNRRAKPIIDRDPKTGRILRTLPCES